jgi:addiction module HigA family antidote
MIRTDPFAPIHPGEFLREDWLIPLGMTPGALARGLGVPRPRIERIVRERNPITSDTALRLARFFKTTPEYWLKLQVRYDLETAQDRIGEALNDIVPAERPDLQGERNAAA